MDSPTTSIGLAFGSSRLPCQGVAQSTTPRTGRSSLIAAIAPQTPDPSTPELCWKDTPTASSIPTTPEDDSESDSGTSVPLSPSIDHEHRAKLRRITSLGLPPSSKLHPRNTSKYSAPLSTPFTTLMGKAVGTELPKTLALNSAKDEHKLEDSHGSLSSKAQSSMTHMGETSSHRPTFPLSCHDAVIKLEEKEPVPPSEFGGDSDEVPSPSGLCDPFTTPVTPKASDNVDCETASAMVDTRALITTKIGFGTSGNKAFAVSGTADDSLKLSVSWTPSATLQRLLPNDVIERLRHRPRKCVATTLRGFRCENPNAAKLTTEYVDKLLKDLSTLPSQLEVSSIMKIVQKLASQATCLRHHQKPVKKEFLELSPYATFEITEKVSKITTNRTGTETTNKYSAFHFWAQNFLTVHVPIQLIAKSEVEATGEVFGTSSTFKVDRAPSDDKSIARKRLERERIEPLHRGKGIEVAIFMPVVTWDRLLRSSVQARPTVMFAPRTFSQETRSTHLHHDFRPYSWSVKQKNMSAPELIREYLTKPLSSADLERKGFIYVFWHPGNFGYVKIGYSKNVEKRLQQWRRQCGFEVEQVQVEQVQVEQVTNPGQIRQFEACHLHRVECLIQAELKDYRLEEPCCPGCESKHKEWFGVNPNLALRVAEKWSKLSLYEGKYLRQSLTMAEIEQLCELTTLEEIVTPKVKPGPKPASTERIRHLRRSSPGTGLVADPGAAALDDSKEVYTWPFSL
jgi:hypothetical protein